MKPNRDAQHGADSAGDPYLPESGNGGYRTQHYDLTLTYRPGSNRLDGAAQIDATATVRLVRFSLDLAGFKVTKVTIAGQRAARFAVRGKKLVIWPGREIAAGEAFRIGVNYSGNPRPIKSRWGEVGWEELTDGAMVVGQPNGAPSWFPCNDHPSDKATYTISITTDSPYVAIANGTLIQRRSRASLTTWVYTQAHPMATYLASVQIGRYDLLDLARAPVHQRAALPPRLKSRFARDFGRQEQMMRCFTDRFGAYPYGEYTVVVTEDPLEIPLEAQGLSIFGSNYLDGGRSHERLVAHELAHQWFGNSLTVAAWQHIWLNEGFACYAEWLWSEDSGGPTTDQLAEKYWKRLNLLPQDLVVGDPGPELMFDDRLYKRGALTLHALRRTVDDEAFFDLLRGWVAANSHGSVSTDAFLDHVERRAGRVVRELLTTWLHAAALPDLPATTSRR
jgi:aminopeptidase N